MRGWDGDISAHHKVSLKYKKPDPPDQQRQSSGGSFCYISESIGRFSLYLSGSAGGRPMVRNFPH